MSAQDGAKKADASRAATLIVNNKQMQMPVRSGTIGPDVVDVAKLYRDTGCFTYDPGQPIN